MRMRLEYMGNKGYEQAMQDIKKLNLETAKLDLNRNDLYINQGANLIGKLKNLNPAIRSLEMRCNAFFSLSKESFRTVLSLIPLHVDTLDLSFNDFRSRDPEEFVSSLECLPITVKKLDLIGNGLPDSTSYAISKAFSERDISINVGRDDEHACMIFNRGKQKLLERLSFFCTGKSIEMDLDNQSTTFFSTDKSIEMNVDKPGNTMIM